LYFSYPISGGKKTFYIYHSGQCGSFVMNLHTKLKIGL